MLRCLGLVVDQPTKLFGDNLAVIQNASFPDADLKKKHVAISFHLVRESVAHKITAPYHVRSENNYSDILTKSLPSSPHITLAQDLFYSPPHRSVAVAS
jgi:hypothetical protein